MPVLSRFSEGWIVERNGERFHSAGPDSWSKRYQVLDSKNLNQRRLTGYLDISIRQHENDERIFASVGPNGRKVMKRMMGSSGEQIDVEIDAFVELTYYPVIKFTLLNPNTEIIDEVEFKRDTYQSDLQKEEINNLLMRIFQSEDPERDEIWCWCGVLGWKLKHTIPEDATVIDNHFDDEQWRMLFSSCGIDD